MHNKYIIMALLFLLACDNSPTNTDPLIDDVDLDSLFAAPSASEIAQVTADWQTRDISARNIKLLYSDSVFLDVEMKALEVISHQVDTSTHIGALITPIGGLNNTPDILVYLHGGDDGTSMFEISLVLNSMHINLTNTILVVPSFRGETFTFIDTTFSSSAESSPWDRDVDDALALLNAAIEYHSITGAPKIALLGFSIGAGVGLLMSIRDPRIAGMVEFFGPTYFFDGFNREVAEETFAGHPRDLPGLNYINEHFLIPLQAGELSGVIPVGKRFVILLCEGRTKTTDVKFEQVVEVAREQYLG